MGRKKSDAEAVLTEINEAMSGVEWDAQVANQIADIMHRAGYEIAEPDAARMPAAACPKCGKREDLYVTETYLAFHPYDAQRHSAACDMPDDVDGEEDHGGYCGSCGHKGTLEEFGMKLLEWNDAEEEDDCAHAETSDTPDAGLSGKPCRECGYYFADEE